MKTLLIAAIALTIAAPAWAQIAATTTTSVNADTGTTAVTTPGVAITTGEDGSTTIVTPDTNVTTNIVGGGSITTTTPTVTYEQAFTSCTESTEAVAGDKHAAVSSCMTEKGFTLKEEGATTTTTSSTETTATTTTEAKAE